MRWRKKEGDKGWHFVILPVYLRDTGEWACLESVWRVQTSKSYDFEKQYDYYSEAF